MREIESDCCCSISKHKVIFCIISRDQKIRLLILANKKSSPTLSLQNLAASVVETVTYFFCHVSALFTVERYEAPYSTFAFFMESQFSLLTLSHQPSMLLTQWVFKYQRHLHSANEDSDQT